MREYLARYVVTVDVDDLDVLALWAAHTYVVNETYATPRLLLDDVLEASGQVVCGSGADGCGVAPWVAGSPARGGH